MAAPARPRLSVCCMTVDPPARVAALLGLLRDVADEVVVAVDDRIDPDDRGPIAAVADRVLPFTFRPPVDRPRAWLAAECRGEWLLTIDGDEVPSPALAAALPELVAARDVQQYHLPTRWVWPDPGRWLAGLPWWPDFHNRLVRNDATLAVRGGTHAGIVPVLPARHLEVPIYHLDLVATSEVDRAAKAATYEAERPGVQAHGGGPLNETLYRPERQGDPPTLPVPAEDRPWIDRVLAAAPAGRVAARPGPTSASGSAPAGQGNGDGRLPDDAYRVGWELPYGDDRMAPGEVRPLYVRVTNQGSATWPWGLEQHPEIRVAYHWWRPDGTLVDYEGRRSPLPCRLGPGESTIVPVWVAAPATPGDHVLELDLVHEHVRWFEDPLRVAIQVAERPGRETGATARC